VCPSVDRCDATKLPELNWDHFRYVPALDDKFFALEVFNGASDFGSAPGHNAPPEGWYAYALDRGWHLGAVGAEDIGHHRGDDWGSPGLTKTIVLAADRSAASLEQAMRARHVYAIRREGYRMRFSVDRRRMGARLVRPAGAPLRVRAAVTAPSGGAAAGGPVRIQGGQNIAYSSPVWITTRGPAARLARTGGTTATLRPAARPQRQKTGWLVCVL
jgi:hypothetical protein